MSNWNLVARGAVNAKTPAWVPTFLPGDMGLLLYCLMPLKLKLPDAPFCN